MASGCLGTRSAKGPGSVPNLHVDRRTGALDWLPVGKLASGDFFPILEVRRDILKEVASHRRLV
jgi:hypothetical protein